MSKDKEMPEKADLKSLDISATNREKLKQLFPSVFTETKNDDSELVESIDFEKLKAEVGTFSDVLESRRERYGMDWPGKKDCMKLIRKPSVATLKPCRKESVNFDETDNLFIEGDNLEVLKLLQKSYYGKIKMIYIDPPYNTGKEFIYPDDYSESLDTYLAYAGLVDDEGKKFSTNTESEGRFHTRWLNMMYPRLYLARNLLRKDGVIFISIDENEVRNLRHVCDEVFGEENFLTQFCWRTDGNFDNQAKFKKCHEYILVYGKYSELFPHPPVVDPNIPSDSKLFREHIRNTIVKNGPKNPVSSVLLPIGFPADFDEGRINAREDSWPHYAEDAVIQNGRLRIPVSISSGWSSKDLLMAFINNECKPVLDSKRQNTTFIISNTGAVEAVKQRQEEQSHVITVLSSFGGPQKATAELESLDIPFDDYPKPIDLIKYFVQMNVGRDTIVLDFFAGSCTTAHAILDLNIEDSGCRTFIMVQLPEPCDDDSSAGRAGYRTIAELGKERIRRAITKCEDNQKEKAIKAEGDLIKKDEQQTELDLGFKVLKLDKSNFNVWDGSKPETTEVEIAEQLDAFVEHIDPQSTQEDILYELLLKAGFKLTEKIEKKEVAGKSVFDIRGGSLLICLEDEITKELIDAIAEAEPIQFICLDRGFKGNDQLKANAVQTFSARNQGRDKTEQIIFRTI